MVNQNNSDKQLIIQRWKGIYIIGGVFSIIVILIGLAEIIFTFLPDGGAEQTTVMDWFNLFQRNPFMGMRNLGLVNIFLVSFGIPVTITLYLAHSKVDKPLALLAMVVSLLGSAIFFATNRTFPMLELSSQYITAITDTQKVIIEAAGKSMLAVGESHTPGTFLAFFISTLGGLLISIVMLRNNIFGKVNAIIGIISFCFLMLFEVLSDFIASLNDITMGVAMVGGILNMVWHVLIAIRLFYLGNSSNNTY